MLPVDRYFLHELRRMQLEAHAGFESYSFIRVHRAVTNFTNVHLSAFYSSVVKNRLYCDAPDSMQRRSAQTALFEALQVRCTGGVRCRATYLTPWKPAMDCNGHSTNSNKNQYPGRAFRNKSTVSMRHCEE
jgi:hypothetical protein